MGKKNAMIKKSRKTTEGKTVINDRNGRKKCYDQKVTKMEEKNVMVNEVTKTKKENAVINKWGKNNRKNML